ncbi:hypothetical protein D3C87_1297930 [compost metagenome]
MQRVFVGTGIHRPPKGKRAGCSGAAIDGVNHLDAVAGGQGAATQYAAGIGSIANDQVAAARCRSAVDHQFVRR